ncbi:hypothetical protein I4U23_015788 [Adineta vaga]|nr:hypothetical protein I4U23_015788 [Adineta vaga]
MVRHRRFREKYRSKSSTKENSKRRMLPWIKLTLSASVPLMIAVFTIVSYVQQMQMQEQNRQRDEELANATRYHDLKLANLTQTKDWDIAEANLMIANETKIQDRQIAEENREEDRMRQQDLHYETVYSKYIDDISTILYKHPTNQSTFIDDEMKILYIRRKTLMTLRSIDSERRSQLFLFLYENNLLPSRSSSSKNMSLAGADLRNITIRSPVVGSYRFQSLSLKSVDLTNATFIGCEFYEETDFNGSSMVNVKFIDTTFKNQLIIHKVNLTNASFINCAFMNRVEFVESRFDLAQFIRSKFEQLTSIDVTFLNASFQTCIFCGPTEFILSREMNGISFVDSKFQSNRHQFGYVSLNYSDFQNTSIENTDFNNSYLVSSNFDGAYLRNVRFFSGALLINSSFENTNFSQIKFAQTNLFGAKIDLTDSSNFQFDNIILPNGTWMINSEKLIRNGDAEATEEDFQWTTTDNDLPVLYHHNKTGLSTVNSTIGARSFECSSKTKCKMEQRVELNMFQIFRNTGEVEYIFSAYFGTDRECSNNSIQIRITFRQTMITIGETNPYIKSLNHSIYWQKIEHRFVMERMRDSSFNILIYFNDNSASCYLDNIELHLKQK